MDAANSLGRARRAARLCVRAAVLACVASIALLAAVSCKERSRRAAYVCKDCNVLLISMDTLRADHVGAYGYARATTPNIDALAAGGVVFENAISQSSWTRPAHMSIFTGLYPAEHGFVALADRERLSDDVPTLARILAHNGYSTAAFTGGVNMLAVFGFDQGFQSFRTNGKYFRDNLEDTRYWLEQHRGEKFFLFWHGYDAHTPYLNDPIDRHALAIAKRPPEQALRSVCQTEDSDRRIDPFLDEYDAAIHRGDRYVGKLLAAMRGLDMLERTIVVFLSDHGEEFLEHGGCFHLNTLYREVLHVPLIFAAPGLPPGRVAELVPASIGVGPTILDLVGIDGAELPGPSMAGALSGRAIAVDGVVSETSHSQEHRGKGHVLALTTAHRKLIEWISQGRREVFDLDRDPGELHPAIDEADSKELSARLAEWSAAHSWRESAAEPAPDTEQTREQMRRLEEELRALGYLE